MMSFGERNWHGILPAKDMSGYGPAGRGAILPQKIPSQRILPRKEFLYHLFILWKSIICQIYWDEWSSWGRCWWKWLFSLGKTRFALMFLMNSARPRRKKKKILPGRDPILSTQRIPRGRDPIISTQRLPRGRDPILSTQRFSVHFWDFWMRNRRIYWKCFPLRGLTG